MRGAPYGLRIGITALRSHGSQERAGYRSKLRYHLAEQRGSVVAGNPSDPVDRRHIEPCRRSGRRRALFPGRHIAPRGGHDGSARRQPAPEYVADLQLVIRLDEKVIHASFKTALSDLGEGVRGQGDDRAGFVSNANAPRLSRLLSETDPSSPISRITSGRRPCCSIRILRASLTPSPVKPLTSMITASNGRFDASASCNAVSASAADAQIQE